MMPESAQECFYSKVYHLTVQPPFKWPFLVFSNFWKSIFLDFVKLSFIALTYGPDPV